MPFCPGTELIVRIPVHVENCLQRLRAKVFDSETGETLHDYKTVDVSPGETGLLEFPLRMPWKPLLLRIPVERYDGLQERWVTVDGANVEVGLIEPLTEVGTLEVPDRFCAGATVEPKISVRAVDCPQRIRSRLVDRETGEVIWDWRVAELEPTKSTIFSFPFRMPWRDMLLGAEVERYDRVEERWEPVAAGVGRIEQKVPATGRIVSTSIPTFARPGYGTSGSSVIANRGECGGDIEVEAFLAGERVARDTFTMLPGASRTSIYSAVTPPLALTAVEFRVRSPREGRYEQTASEIGETRAAWAVVLEEIRLRFLAGDEALAFSGILVAKHAEIPKPMLVRESKPFILLEPLPVERRVYIFAGRVPASGDVEIPFSGLSFLKGATDKPISYCSHGRLEQKETRRFSYGTVGGVLGVSLGVLPEALPEDKSLEELIGR